MFIPLNLNPMKLKPPLILGIIFLSTFNCKSTQDPLQQFQTTAPIQIIDPYYNAWIAGIEDTGSGINVFLPTTGSSRITIDSLHFRGEKSAVEIRDQLIIGRFKYTTTRKKDIIFSADRRAEYGNTLPPQFDASPFILSQNECVISYQVNNKRLYYKVSNLKKGESLAYPAATPKTP